MFFRGFLIWLSLTAFCLPVSIALSSLTLFPCLGVFILAGAWTFRRWPMRWTTLETLFAIFYAVSLLSAFTGLDAGHSRVRLSKDLYFLMIPIFVAILSVETEHRSRLMKAVLIGGLVTAAFGLLQVAVGIDHSERTGWAYEHLPNALSNWPNGLLKILALNDTRATGFRSHPITFGETLIFPLTYLLARLGTRTVVSLRHWGIAFSILLLALVYSQSRGPWLAFGCISILLIILEPPTLPWLIASFILPGALLLCVPSLHRRAASISDPTHQSNTERVQMWQVGIRIIRDHPLLGVGPGNAKLACPAYQSPEQAKEFGPWGHLHSTYVTLAAERGLLGLFSLLSMIGWIGWELFRSYRKTSRKQGEERTLLLTGILAVVGWLVCGLTQATYHDSSVLMVFYCVVAVALSTARTYWRT